MANEKSTQEKEIDKAIWNTLRDSASEMFQKSCANILWVNADGQKLANGTMFFVRTKERCFGITARHVIDGYHDDFRRHDGNLTLIVGYRGERYINRLNLHSHIISMGADRIDIATVDIEPLNIERYASDFLEWKLEDPVEKLMLQGAGFPGFLCDSQKGGLVNLMHPVKDNIVLDSEHFKINVPDYEWWLNADKIKLPKNEFKDLGGISGGPVCMWARKNQNDLTTGLYLTGVFKEASPLRSEFIQIPQIEATKLKGMVNLDGSIRKSSYNRRAA